VILRLLYRRVSNQLPQNEYSSSEFSLTYINELLLTLERNRVGTHTGTTYVGCPTVADDLALLDLQLMLDVTNSFANREKYVIHLEKSTIIMRIPK
jgi:hypothetical protein